MEEFRLEPGERVTRTVRKHWFVLLMSFVPFLLLAWLPTVLPQLLLVFSGNAPQVAALFSSFSSENPWFRLFLGMWWLLLWIGAFNAFTQYYLNHWVITTTRIVRISQRGFFSREVSSFLLIKVQDVSTSVDGIFADLLGYGCVRVETAGDASRHFSMDGVDNPTGMRDLIMNEIAALYAERNTTHVASHGLSI